MTFARMTTKGQVTIPKEVRDELNLKAGDVLSYDVKGGVAYVRKAEGFNRGWHDAVSQTLEEWNSPEDEEAFRDL